MVKRISQNIGKRITRTKTEKEKIKPEIKWATAKVVLAIILTFNAKSTAFGNDVSFPEFSL